MEANNLYEQVNKRYGSMKRSQTGEYEHIVATAFGYSKEELIGIPEGANLGLSCGNPLVLAKLREGETVIDLGSGAGFDIFLAAKRVGSSGSAIGIDMNTTMIEKANANKATLDEAKNITFVQAAITSIPMPSNVADCIISNCVINLVPTPSEKQLVFHEIYRLLKPGGRVAISDTMARKEMTKDMKRDMALYLGCISGASLVGEYEDFLEKAGFEDVLIVDSKNDLNVYNTALDHPAPSGFKNSPEAPSCCRDGRTSEGKSCSTKPADHNEHVNILPAEEIGQIAAPLRSMDFNEWAGSFQIYAVKPTATGQVVNKP